MVTVNAATSSYTVAYGSASHPFTVKAPAVPTPPPTSASVVIESLLPNPVGNDEQLEEITLRNRVNSALSLTGWILRDRSGLTWKLTGSIGPNQSRTFRRNGQALSLNNTGDEVVLIDGQQVERDRFEYSASVEGVSIATSH